MCLWVGEFQAEGIANAKALRQVLPEHVAGIADSSLWVKNSEVRVNRGQTLSTVLSYRTL